MRTEPGPLGADALLAESAHSSSARVGARESAVLVAISSEHARHVLQLQPELRMTVVHNSALLAAKVQTLSGRRSSRVQTAQLRRMHSTAGSVAAAMDAFSAPASAVVSEADVIQQDAAQQQRPRPLDEKSEWTDGRQHSAKVVQSAAAMAAVKESKFLPTWHRARAILAARHALSATLPSGVRGDDAVPWSLLIATASVGDAGYNLEDEPQSGAKKGRAAAAATSGSKSLPSL